VANGPANIRAQRPRSPDQKGWTQEKLAHNARLAPVQVSRIERGKREVRLTTVLKLIAALEVAPDDLLSDLY
jgi:transcriptional regulator with XRE-family HTH domain